MELVKTYDSKEFISKFAEFKNEGANLFKTKSELFFCLKIQDGGHLKYPIPPSILSCHTILFITSGIYNIKVGYEKYTVKSNEIIIVPAGHIFSIDTVDIKLEGIICQVHPDFLIGKYRSQEKINNFDFLKTKETTHVCFQDREAGFVLNLLNRLETEYNENGSANLDIIYPYTIALLA